MHILISPNAFKGSLDANRAARAIERGLKEGVCLCSTECFPIADGGDGTSTLLMDRLKGKEVRLTVHDPLGRAVSAWFGLVENETTAIVEMASASGLRLLKSTELDPMKALSTGTGELIMAAIERGVRKIVVTMGGSATVDGGVGIMQALGAKFLDRDLQPLQHLPASLTDLRHIDLTSVDPRLKDCEIIVLCDVNNKLLGEHGAAAVFGPQKGATPEQVEHLDRALSRLSEVVLHQTNRDMTAIKYGGTAGGASAGLFAMTNAQLVNGIDYFLDMTGFDAALRRSNLVITGEGRIDEQTLQGKGPYGVAVRARAAGIPVIGLAGQVDANRHTIKEYFRELIAINNDDDDLASAMKNTEVNLVAAARALSNKLSAMK